MRLPVWVYYTIVLLPQFAQFLLAYRVTYKLFWYSSDTAANLGDLQTIVIFYWCHLPY